MRLNTRTDLINAFAEQMNARTYLEIGLRHRSRNFDKIRISEKVSVDPDPKAGADFVTTSDEFFKGLGSGRRWDIIFVDGLHTAEQVYRDIYHSFLHVSERGYVIVHDCNPLSEYASRSKDYSHCSRL